MPKTKKVVEYEVEDWQTAWAAAKTEEEREQAIEEYRAAKLRNAERREEARLNGDSRADREAKRAEKRKRRAQFLRDAGIVMPGEHVEQSPDVTAAAMRHSEENLRRAEEAERARLGTVPKKQSYGRATEKIGTKIKNAWNKMIGKTQSHTK